MLRPLVLASLLASAAGLGGGALGPLPPLPLLSAPSPDALTVTISKTGHRSADGTFKLECGDKAGGDHPAADGACRRLADHAKARNDPFAPVGKDRICSLQHGGDAVAHITGEWRGRTVDARFSRANGCEIERWENLEPLLPRLSHVRG
ncbi:SSI family serine proteinase inhibitor [Streptomyces sp. P9(2023)]|uniref:SSI family serine proteinase inhibitor n=1 Tax=Streptomyces sp. P9(2023) TaxID=3064394 RepID=UPI0028F4525E|nr:SSI family serine proteinase inhibitor [Streptomyces sp. P9(2023)]MDT9693482.1 SSI family serine proteinase inhibitor [Streptomyces sp. P9(2023)]